MIPLQGRARRRIWLCVALAGSAVSPLLAQTAPQGDCARLLGMDAGADTVVTSATVVAAMAGGPAAAPSYCDVRGTIRGNIQFAVWLPSNTWNGRFQMVGNGGKAGVISFDAMRLAVRGGFASSSTDTGHDNAKPAERDSRFGNDTLFGKEREIDFGYRSVNLTARASKAVIAAYYGKAPSRSYWNGCSTGGRQGLVQAQRYPEDFDGYVIGAPVHDYTAAQMGAPALLGALYSAIPPRQPGDGPHVSPAKRNAIGNVIYNGLGEFKGCDIEDGVRDGQLRDPYACSFDVDKHIPDCTGSADQGVCLTAGERAALRQIYAGREPYVPRTAPGSENIPGGWNPWLIPDSPNAAPLLHAVVGDSMEWLMFTPDRPGFDYFRQFDWTRDPPLMREAAQIYSATSPDLRRAQARGAKIIMYHGYQDTPAQPLRSIRYRQSVIDFLASQPGSVEPAQAQSSTDAFLRLFMVPGMAHCGGGVGHSVVDWMSPLVRWVEADEAPEAIVGTKPGTTSTRPHCPYPKVAIHDGRGDPALAPSFRCGVQK